MSDEPGAEEPKEDRQPYQRPWYPGGCAGEIAGLSWASRIVAPGGWQSGPWLANWDQSGSREQAAGLGGEESLEEAT